MGQCHSVPLEITLGSFRICSKIGGDIRKSRCTTSGKNFPPMSVIPAVNFATPEAKTLPPVSMTLAVNFATGPAGVVVDTCGKFATDVNDTSGK